MDNKDLFRREENGYNTADVEKYINTLKTEYRRVFEYAKKNETDNEKLKRICRKMSEENKALKASGATVAAAAPPTTRRLWRALRRSQGSAPL